MKKKKGFDLGRMVLGCAFVGFVCVFAWIMSDVLVATSLRDYETVPCRIVKSSVKMEKVNRFIFAAEFAYEYLGKAYKSNSLRKPGRGEFEFDRLASRLPLLEKYAVGTEHECLVNPENPFDAVLAVENPVEDQDALSGKNLIPFSTHEGSGLSGFDKKLASAIPGSTVLKGLAVRGNDCQNKQEDVRNSVDEWVSELGY